MRDNTKRLYKLYQENETAFKCMIQADTIGGVDLSVLNTIKRAIVNASIDPFIYQAMENDILKGNFDVIYLDDRIVGDNKKRIAARKELDRIRKTCIDMKKQGKEVFSILFER